MRAVKEMVISLGNIRRFSAAGSMKVTKHSFKFKPLIICGPSGVGKGTITDLLLKEHGDKFAKGVSHTTRNPRPGEQHGREYYFVKDAKHMRSMIEKGDFLEHAVVHGNLYGTSFQTLKDIEGLGKICVLDIDVYGLKQVIESAGAHQLNRVGILPVSEEDLERRLRGRGTETDDVVKKRLHAAKEEIRSLTDDGIVDATIINDDSWKIGYP